MAVQIPYPLDLFRTTINLSQDYIKRTPNIFTAADIIRRDRRNVYILNELYKLEIEKYQRDKKIQPNNNIRLLNIFNNKFIALLRPYLHNPPAIEEFCKLFIKYKNYIIAVIQDINSFFILFNVSHKKNENIYFSNPLNPNSELSLLLIDAPFLSDRIRRPILGTDENHIKIALNIFMNSSIINIKMPSIGVINFYPGLDVPNCNTFLNFIEFILNNMMFDESNISAQIPLKSLNVGDTLCDILLNDRPIENLNLNNLNVFSNRFNNSAIRANIIDVINRIQINLNDVIRYKKSKTKENRANMKYKVKPEYLIPYKVYTPIGGIRENKIIYMKKSEIDKELDSLDKTFLHNQKTLRFVIDQTVFLYLSNVPDDKERAIANLDKPNFKNVLACFMYILIRLIYTINKNYIDQINDTVVSMSSTKKGKFRGLNYKDALEYLSLLDMSLLNFRNILLNNFYNMFLPSKITKKGYGMTSDSNGCFVPEPGCAFLGDSENILSNLPIVGCLDMDNYQFPAPLGINVNMYNIDLDKLYNFICKIVDKNDIYDRTKTLEMGGYVFNKDIMKFISKLLKEYYTHLKNVMEYNLFIFEKLTNYFNVKKMIPFEAIEDFRILVDEMTRIPANITNRNAPYQDLERILFTKFEYNLSKSSEYYKKMYSTKMKITKIKQNNVSKLYSYQDMYLMCFNIFYRRAMVLYSMTENLLNNSKLKFSLLKKYNERKKFYEDEITDFMRTF